MRTADRLTGRGAPDARSPFAVRAFGTSIAEAAAIAAAAAAPTGGLDIPGATGGAGTNLTTSSSPRIAGGDGTGSSRP